MLLRGVAVGVIAELLQKGRSSDRVGFEEEPPLFYSEIVAAGAEVADVDRAVVVVEASRRTEIAAADRVVPVAGPAVLCTYLGKMVQRPT